MRIVISLLTIIGLILLSGCWDAEDIEEFNIPIIASYDIVDKKPEEQRIIVTSVFPDITTKNKEIFEPISGKTIGETRARRGLRYPSSLLLGQIQVNLYGEKIAEKGLGSFIDTHLRSPRVKNTVYMLITEGQATDFLEKANKGVKNLGFELRGIFTTKKKNDFFPATTMHEFANQRTASGKNPIVPMIQLIGKDQYFISGTAIFKKDKMIAKVNQDETRVLVMLRGSEECCGFIPFEVVKNGQKVDRGTIEVKNKRKVTVTRKGDNFHFNIKIYLKGILVEHYATDKLAFADDSYINDIEKAVEQDIRQQSQQLIRKMQEEFKVDCIDISKYALAKWRNELKDVIDQEEFIKNAAITVDVEVEIIEIGLIG